MLLRAQLTRSPPSMGNLLSARLNRLACELSWTTESRLVRHANPSTACRYAKRLALPRRNLAVVAFHSPLWATRGRATCAVITDFRLPGRSVDQTNFYGPPRPCRSSTVGGVWSAPPSIDPARRRNIERSNSRSPDIVSVSYHS